MDHAVRRTRATPAHLSLHGSSLTFFDAICHPALEHVLRPVQALFALPAPVLHTYVLRRSLGLGLSVFRKLSMSPSLTHRYASAAPSLRPVYAAVLLALAAHTHPVLAQDAAAPVAATLPELTISASGLALGSSDMTTPVSVLEGDALVLRREATLGETLESEPGMRSSHFGAGASRPIIRGMDGPRVRVLSDGSEVHDASSMSPDHAVGVEPMLAQQIEVLRGPSALVYGGGAVGGVVNVLDRKIPTAIPDNGVEGNVELRGNSAAREAAGAFDITAGAGNFAIHAEGVKRNASDYRVGSGWEQGRRVNGSYNKTDTGSLGLSWIGDRGYLGVAFTSQRNTYGLPGHNHSFEGCHTHGDHLHCGEHDGHDHGAEGEDEHDHEAEGVPFVKLRSERWDLRGEYRQPIAGISKIRVRASNTDYQHEEIEGDVVSTRFVNKARDGRLELEHDPIAGVKGVMGFQTSQRDFSALGEETFIQPTVTRKHAVFLLEEYRLGDWRFEAALRHEWQRVTAETSELARSHSGTSASVGAVWKLVPGYSLGASLSHTHRLPTAEELFADGLHMATSTYERGNPDLKKEPSRNIDLTLRQLAGPTTFSVGVFRNNVRNFIYGNTVDEHEGLQLLDYTQRNAVFTGIEGQVRQQFTPVLGATVFGDYVRARLEAGDGNRNLPRIPSARVGVRLDANWQQWMGEVEWFRMGRQSRTADFESSTPGYNMLNVAVRYNLRTQRYPTQIYLKATNLTDTLAFSHTSFIKNAAPLMGRNVTVGVRVAF